MSEITGSASETPETDVPVDITMNEINELVQLFNDSDWDGLELELRGVKLRLGRKGASFTDGQSASPGSGTTAISVPPPAAPAVEPTQVPASRPPEVPAPNATTGDEVEQSGDTSQPGTGPRTEVTAPVVGAFWVAPSPGEEPFVRLGDRVSVGQQLAIVEVMKLMSNVSSPIDGRVVEINATDAELVEFGQVLFVIEGDDE